MKRISILVLLLSSLFCICVQKTFATTNENDTVIVDIGAGMLYTYLGYYNGGWYTRHLIVKGEMNGFDFNQIKNICWEVNVVNRNLRSADISDVRVIGRKNDVYKVTTDNTLNQGIFDDFNLDYIILPKSLKLIKENTFDDNSDIRKIWLYATDSLVIEDYAFNSKNIDSVNIITDSQIPNDVYEGINKHCKGWPEVNVYVPKGCAPEYEYANSFEMKHNYVEYERYSYTTEKPTISVDENNVVTISCEEPEAKIYYKIIDGDDTNYWPISKFPETEYKEPFAVSRNCLVKAFAVCENEDYSDMATLDIESFKMFSPSISTDSVVSINSANVTLSCQDSEAMIYYTIDGTEPTENSTLYTGTFTLERCATVKAAAIKDGFIMSDVTSLDVVVKVATPKIYYYNGGYATIIVSCVGTVHYTTDGTEPDENSVVYDTDFIRPGFNCTYKFKAFKEGCVSSDVATLVVDDIQLLQPEISVVDGVVTIKNNSLEQEFTQSDDLADIYYTLDGSEPNENGILYTEPFVIDGNCEIRAIAVMEKRHTSNVAFYSVQSFECKKPLISLWNDKVTITTNTEDAEIYYTLDNTEPTQWSTLYKEPFDFKNGIVKAVAVKKDYLASPVSTYSRLVWLQEFDDVAVGDKIQLEIEITGGIHIGFRNISGGAYRSQNVFLDGNVWYAEFMSAGPTQLEAYIEGADILSPIRKTFNVQFDHDVMLIDGLYYRYSDEKNTSLNVTFGYKSYSRDVVIPSVAGGLFVTGVDDMAFYTCPDLTSVILPEGLTHIESDQAFGNCPNLSKVILPSTLTYIGSYAFNVDSGLKEIYCNMRDPSKVEIAGGESIFNGYIDYDNCILHVPYGCAQVYREAEVWKNFKNIIEGEKVPIPVVSIQFENESMVMTEGDVAALQVTVLPEDADNKALAWSSSDDGVVSVNSEGVITAVSVGQATITAAAVDGSGVEGRCVVEVVPLLIGDSNGDNAVTVTDAVNTANYAMEKEVAEPFTPFSV